MMMRVLVVLLSLAKAYGTWSLFKQHKEKERVTLYDQYNISYTVAANSSDEIDEREASLQLLEEEWWEIERTSDFIYDAFPTVHTIYTLYRTIHTIPHYTHYIHTIYTLVEILPALRGFG